VLFAAGALLLPPSFASAQTGAIDFSRTAFLIGASDETQADNFAILTTSLAVTRQRCWRLTAASWRLMTNPPPRRRTDGTGRCCCSAAPGSGRGEAGSAHGAARRPFLLRPVEPSAVFDQTETLPSLRPTPGSSPGSSPGGSNPGHRRRPPYDLLDCFVASLLAMTAWGYRKQLNRSNPERWRRSRFGPRHGRISFAVRLIHESPGQPDIGDVCDPNPIEPRRDQIARQIGNDRKLMPAVGGVGNEWLLAQKKQFVLAHEA